MRPEDRDESLIWDIREHAREAIEITSGFTQESFFGDSVRNYAIKYVLMTIGEASYKLSGGFRQRHPEIPWDGIIGLRHRLAHDYGNIDLDRLWKAATEDCLVLIGVLDELIPDIDVPDGPL